MKLKFFWLFLLLTFSSGIYMVILGFDLKKEKGMQKNAVYAKNRIENWSKEIGGFRAKLKAERKFDNKIEITQANISRICTTNNVQMQYFNALKPIDRGEFLEAGYNIKISGVSKKDLSVIFWDIENKIAGSKIKSVRMSRSTRIKKLWIVTFIIIKSIPKFDQEETAEK